MFTEFKFVKGVDPTSVRERELAISERKSQAAKNAHQRRKARLLQSRHGAATSCAPSQTVQTAATGEDDAAPIRSPGDGTMKVEPIIWAETSPSLAQNGSIDWSVSAASPASRRPLTKCVSAPDCASYGTISHSKKAALMSPHQASRFLRQPQSPSNMAFKTAAEARSFDFWCLNTGPLSSRYALFYTSVWKETLPQLALNSAVVRHMLLGHALSHERLYYAQSPHSQATAMKALYHYHSGVKLMSEGVSQLELAASALLGYSYESIYNNQDTAMMHLIGCTKMLGDIKADDSIELMQLKEYMQVIAETSSFLTGDGGGNEAEMSSDADELPQPKIAHGHELAFTTHAEARAAMAALIPRIQNHGSDEAMINEIQQSCGEYFRTILSLDFTSPPSNGRTALMLLLNMAMGQLPEHVAGVMSYKRTPLQWRYVLGNLERFLDDLKSSPSNRGITDAEDDLLTTCKMMGTYLLKFVKDPDCQSRASLLLQHIADRRAAFGVKIETACSGAVWTIPRPAPPPCLSKVPPAAI